MPPESAQSFRHRIEDGFAAWGERVVTHARVVALLALLVTVGLTAAIPGIRSESSMESFLHPSDPALIRYNAFRDQFGRDERIVVGLAARDVFELEFLERVRALQRDLEAAVPYLEEVTSLLNVRATYGRGDELVVEDLFERWPQDAAELERLRARAFDTPLYRNLVISEDARFTALVLKPFTYSAAALGPDELAGFEVAAGAGSPSYLTQAEQIELVHALHQVIERHRAPDFQPHLVGGPVMTVTLDEALQRDVVVFIGITLAVISVLLALLFRRVTGVLLPLLVVVSALLSTLGFMVLLDLPMTTAMQILPAFLLAVGVCDSVHLLVLVYRRLAGGAERGEAIAWALGHSGLAILMTSLTTAAGLLSFTLAELRPVMQLGIMAPIGVLFAFAYSVTLLPALLALAPLKVASRAERRAGGRLADRFLARVGDFSTRHAVGVVVATGLLLLVSLDGLARVRFSHDALSWFPEDDPLRVAAETIDDAFQGVTTLEFIIDSGTENGLHDPATLERIGAASDWALGFEGDAVSVANTISVVDIVKETHRALNENRRSHYAIPGDRPLLAQELLLFEQSGSDDLEDVTDTRFQLARLTLRVPWLDAITYPDFIGAVTDRFSEILGPDVSFHVTGVAEIFSRTFRAMVLSLGRSYVVALAVIAPLMMLLIGSVKRGLVAMIPNLLPVLLTLALMGWLGIPLDASTLLMGAIVLGVAVDDTIHFMHKFNRYLEDTGEVRAAVHETLMTTGSALLFTSLVLGAGFSTMLFAYMENAQQFGRITTFAVGVAFLADVVLAPALMTLAVGDSAQRGRTISS